MAQALNTLFKPKLVAVLNGMNSKLLEELQYPICLQPMIEGVNIVIRSGFMRIVPDVPIKNINLKEKLSTVLAETRRLKITLEATITSSVSNRNEHIVPKLLDIEGDADDLTVTINDMVFERCPEAIDYKVRTKDMHVLFREDKVGNYPKFVAPTLITSKKEFIDQINYFALIGHRRFRIASPNCKYKFGELSDLFSKEGGIIDIDTTSEFKGKVLAIEPKVLEVGGKPVYLADSLKIRYGNTITSIKLEEIGTLAAVKIWENREEIIGNTVIFTGLILPTYEYPKFRTFKRFEKTN